VPAGTFFRVEGRSFMRNRVVRVEINCWIAPDEVRSFVVYEYVARRGTRYGKTERMELAGYRQG
jgi:hypothetical protein